MKKNLLKIIITSLIVLVIVIYLMINGFEKTEKVLIEAKAPKESQTFLESVDRIFFFDVKDSAGNGACALIESQGHYGLVDAGHLRKTNKNEHYEAKLYGIENGQEVEYSVDDSLCADKKHGEYIVDCLNNLGITHIDFILATHSHSDHLGGIPAVANSTLVDKTTVYFYKEYVEELHDGTDNGGWKSSAFAYSAKKAMKGKNAILVPLNAVNFSEAVSSLNLLSASEAIKVDDTMENSGYSTDISEQLSKNNRFTNINYSDAGTNNKADYEDNISFDFGNYNIRLYNLFSTVTDGYKDDNVNSIVMTLKKGDTKAALLGDINLEKKAETKVSAAIKKDILTENGKLTLLKAAHHATHWSNSKQLLDDLRPKICLASRKTDPNESTYYYFADFKYYGTEKYETEFYETGDSNIAIVATLGNNENVEMQTIGGENTNTLVSMPKSNRNPQTGWVQWLQVTPPKRGQDISYDANNCYWMYFEEKDGTIKAVKKDWRYLNGLWYYFDEDGIMETGWNKIEVSGGNKYWFYFCEREGQYSGFKQGGMLTGRHQVEYNGTTSWYYFCEANENPEGYVKGAAITGTYGNYTYGSNGIDSSSPLIDYRLTIDPNGGTYEGNTTVLQKANTTVTLGPITTPLPTYQVTFDGNGATNPAPQSLTGNFKKWEVSEGVGTIFGSTYTFGEGNGTVTAKYSAKLTNVPTPTKTGYKFEGWYKDSNYKYKFNSSEDVITEDITLYAKWGLDDKPTWKLQTSNLQQVNISEFARDATDEGGLQGSVVTHKHIVFASLWIDDYTGASHIYFMDKVSHQIDGNLTITVPHAVNGSNSKFGHMNDMTYNPTTGEIFIPYSDPDEEDASKKRKVAIIKYEDKYAGTLENDITIVQQPAGIPAAAMAYNPDIDKYIFYADDKIYITVRDGEGFSDQYTTINLFQNAGEKLATFFYTTGQGIFSKGDYVYITRWESGYNNGHQVYYCDSKEEGSNIIIVYKMNSDRSDATYVKTLYIPGAITNYAMDDNSRNSEIETGSFDPETGKIYLGYDMNRIKGEENKTKIFYELLTGEQTINGEQVYFYENAIPRTDPIITGKDSILNDSASNLVGEYMPEDEYISISDETNWIDMGEIKGIYNKATFHIKFSLNNIKNYTQYLLSNAEGGGYILFVTKDGTLGFQAYIDGAWKRVEYDKYIDVNRIYDVTAVFDETKIELYVDGDKESTLELGGTKTVTVPTNNTIISIGANPKANYVTGGYADIKVYEANIYNEALSEEEICEKLNILRYYNASNNAANSHLKNATKWKDLSTNCNAIINGKTGNVFNSEKIYLDGSDWINIGKIENIYNSVTLETQFSLSEISSSTSYIMSDAQEGGYILFVTKDSTLGFQAYINEEWRRIELNEPINVGVVYNVSATFDGRSLKLYLDGKIKGTIDLGSENNVVTAPINDTVMAIGANPNGTSATGGYTNGYIYSARVYKTALTEEEIKKNVIADRITSEGLAIDSDILKYSINFTGPVANLQEEDIDIENGTILGISKISDYHYILTIQALTNNDFVEISIKEGTNDLYGNNINEKITRNLISYDDGLDDEPIANDISVTNTIKSTSQTATISATDENGVVAYYWGTTSPTSNSTFTDVTSTTNFNTEKNITEEGTYYFAVKDTNGTMSNIKTVTMRSYIVHNLLEKIEGTTGTYTNANYEVSGNNTEYIAKDGTTIVLSSIYDIPTGSNTNNFKGYSTTYGTNAETLSTEAATLNANVTYYMWFNRNTYELELTKGTGIDSVTGAGTYKYGKQVSINAIPSNGYKFSKWTVTSGVSPESTEVASTTITITEETSLNAEAAEIETIPEFDIEEYTYDENIISKVQPLTKRQDFEENITYGNSLSIKVLDKDNNEVQQTENVKTGDKLQIRNISTGEIVKEYLISVKGDVNGDGKLDISDLFAINKHRLGKVLLTGIYLTSGDTDDDNNVGISDILKINRYRLGIINII